MQANKSRINKASWQKKLFMFFANNPIICFWKRRVQDKFRAMG